jgi:hypothetical protein
MEPIHAHIILGDIGVTSSVVLHTLLALTLMVQEEKQGQEPFSADFHAEIGPID